MTLPVLTIVEVPYLGGSKWVVLNDEGHHESVWATQPTLVQAVALVAIRYAQAVRRGA